MVILDLDSMIPEDHLLRRIKNCVNFDFIYEKTALLNITVRQSRQSGVP